MQEHKKEVSENKLRLVIDSNIFEKEALINSTYKFTDKCYISIALNGENFEVLFQSKNQDEILEQISLEFSNEIIDQQIRLQTGREFKEIREQLVKKAFSSINK